ncbi:MAG: hypothetical protein M1838_005269 [Thelocarpon superellum]|nr:MAG: hypothetical protein M1838_005269 [Thelocarpon superellum]
MRLHQVLYATPLAASLALAGNIAPDWKNHTTAELAVPYNFTKVILTAEEYSCIEPVTQQVGNETASLGSDAVAKGISDQQAYGSLNWTLFDHLVHVRYPEAKVIWGFYLPSSPYNGSNTTEILANVTSAVEQSGGIQVPMPADVWGYEYALNVSFQTTLDWWFETTVLQSSYSAGGSVWPLNGFFGTNFTCGSNTSESASTLQRQRRWAA